MSPRVKSSLVLIAVFALGGLTGMGVTRAVIAKRLREMYDGPPLAQMQTLVVAGIERDISLDGDQRRRIEDILARHVPDIEAIHREVAPRSASVRRVIFDDIRATLRPEQHAGFDRFVQRAEARAAANTGK